MADVVADPLTWSRRSPPWCRAGRGRWLVDVPLARVAAWIAAHPDDDAAHEVVATEWRGLLTRPPPALVVLHRRGPRLAPTAAVLAAVRTGGRPAR